MAVPTKSKKIKKRQIDVFFDANAVYSQSITDAIKNEVSDLIEQHSLFPELKIKWTIPEMALKERKRQMLVKAEALMPSISRMEALLGVNWGVTKENLSRHIDEVAEKQIKSLGIEVRKLNTKLVDWNELIHKSAYKLPPFEPGEKEKGFKDAIILETFQQHIQEINDKKEKSQVLLVTGDGLLADTSKAALAHLDYVRVLRDLEELKSELNIYSSNVDQDFAERLVNKATAYFFRPGDERTLYFKKSINALVNDAYGEKLKELRPGATSTKTDKVLIGQSSFVKKHLDKVFFSNRISYELSSLKNKASPAFGYQPIGLERLGSDANSGILSVLSNAPANNASILLTGPEMELVARFKVIVQINWSANLNKEINLISPKIDGIEYIRTDLID